MKEQKQQLVSTIITLYNLKEYIQEAVDSVVNQSYKNWELILVDDCSTDGGFDFISDYIQSLNLTNNVVIVQNEKNLGVGKTIEKALGYVKGEYVSLLDADDVWFEEKLEKQIKFTIDNNYDMTYHDMMVVDGKSEVIYKSFIKNILQKQYNQLIETNEEFLLKGNHCTTSSILFKSEFINKITPLYARRNQDYRIALVISLYGKIGFFEEKLTYYRFQNKSISGTYIQQKINTTPTLLKKIGLYLVYQKKFKKMILSSQEVLYNVLSNFILHHKTNPNILSQVEFEIQKLKNNIDNYKSNNKLKTFTKQLFSLNIKRCIKLIYMRL